MNPQITTNDPSSLPIPVSTDSSARAVNSSNGQTADQKHYPAQAAASAPPVVQQTHQNTSLSPHAPSVASDADLIEKEWVLKAKSIVSRTKDDPRKQSNEINQFKADYIKKRYNKDIKVSEA